jgi:mono/diheme cytochrome c family protein
MDPNRDNPIIRFTTFWWGLGVFLIFALLLALVVIINRGDAPSTSTVLEDAVAKARYQNKADVADAQAKALPKEAITAAIPSVAKSLATSKPVAVEKPDQVVPGSATSKKLAEAPAVDTKAVDAAGDPNAPIDPAVMAAGKTAYMTCLGCHGPEGKGGVIGGGAVGPEVPPLAGSNWVNGPASNLIRIQLRGLQGPITVSGKEYKFDGGMAALNFQTDEQIAAVLTYVRNSFGNKAPAVKPEQVTALRSEVGKPQLTAAELIQP